MRSKIPDTRAFVFEILGQDIVGSTDIDRGEEDYQRAEDEPADGLAPFIFI